MASLTAGAPARKHNKQVRFRQNLAPLAFTVITMALFAIFFVGPGALGLYYSFTNYRGVGSPQWTGLENYTRLFQDSDFYHSLLRTFQYTIAVVPLGYALALLLSVLLVNKYCRGSHAARVIFFLPWLVSPIVSGVIWRWMFGESFGVINFVLGRTVQWQTNANLSLAVVILAGIWGGLAFNMLLFVSALKNIPRSYYEAAEIDGATGFKQFWFITLPLLRPTSFMVVLLGTIGAMKEFAMIQALNGGGPGTSNMLIVQYIYRTGFDRARIGYASAASMVLMVILLLLTLLQMRIDRREELD